MAFEAGRWVGSGLVVLKRAFFASLIAAWGCWGSQEDLLISYVVECWKTNSYLRDDDLMNLVP